MIDFGPCIMQIRFYSVIYVSEHIGPFYTLSQKFEITACQRNHIHHPGCIHISVTIMFSFFCILKRVIVLWIN